MSDNSDTVYNAPANLHGENYTSNESVDANSGNITASTSKNTQDNDMAILKTFSIHNLATTRRGPGWPQHL